MQETILEGQEKILEKLGKRRLKEDEKRQLKDKDEFKQQCLRKQGSRRMRGDYFKRA